MTHGAAQRRYLGAHPETAGCSAPLLRLPSLVPGRRQLRMALSDFSDTPLSCVEDAGECREWILGSDVAALLPSVLVRATMEVPMQPIVRGVLVGTMLVACAKSPRALADSKLAGKPAPTCANVVGQWHNQLGSTLIVKSLDAATGRIEGAYRSPSGTGGEENPLIGWVNTAPSGQAPSNLPVISFSVRWTKYGSITAWNGTCEAKAGVPTITTLWHLARSDSNFIWDHVLAGSDVFVPGAGQP